MSDLREELTAMLYRAEAQGSKVVSIAGVRQLLGDHDEAQAHGMCCCAGCVAGTLCDNANDEERAKAWRWWPA